MKHISADNWLQPDTAGASVVGDAEAWRDAFLRVRLDAAVPAEITAMFEAARGAMIYGRFFAPLMTLGVEHCYRLLETAARVRCEALGASATVIDRQGKVHPLSLDHNLRELAAHDVLDAAAMQAWQQAKELRNWAALPEHQALLTSSHGVTALLRTADLLAGLFARH